MIAPDVEITTGMKVLGGVAVALTGILLGLLVRASRAANLEHECTRCHIPLRTVAAVQFCDSCRNPS